jgi:hypothetical protein
MQVILHDPKNKLTKTQKEKFIRRIKETCKTSDRESIRDAFLAIFYPPGLDGYKDYSILQGENNKLDVFLWEQDQKEVKRAQLKSRLSNAIKSRAHVNSDPHWKMYSDLKKRVTIPLPSPDEIKQNRDLYRGVMERMDHKNPVALYFDMVTGSEQ